MSKKRRHAPASQIRPDAEVIRSYEDRAARQVVDGRIDDAIETLSELLLKFPTRVETLRSLASVLTNADRLAEALEVLAVVKAHLPASGEIPRVMGNIFSRMRLYSQAEQELLEAVRLMPNDVVTKVSLAQVYEQWGKDEEASDTILKAIRLTPTDLDLTCHAAGLLHHSGRDEESQALLLDGSPKISETSEARLLEAMQMPIVPSAADQILAKREHLSEVLKTLRTEGKLLSNPEKAPQATCFQLGYHGLEDRTLIEETAKTMLALAPALGYVSPDLERPPTSNRRLKIGFLSSNMRTHSVGRVLNRFLKELDRERFEVLLFELPGKFGGGQENAREMADRTVFVPKSLKSARAVIEAEKPDILMIPDFVLEPFNDLLAYSRLAPVQVSTWGHPGTSGRPSLDYWISCDDWEPAGNERLYTEKLVRLSAPPMIATRLECPETIATREDLGLPEGRIYGCPQSLYKLHPEFDGILGEVLRRDPGGYVALIGGVQPRWIDTFRRRFAVENADVLDRLIFLPNLATERYLSLLSHCEVSLDPIHFGGANTSMEAFTMGLPVVTLPGGQLRNRQTLSFYRMMDFTDLVVDSTEAYVDTVLRIGKDRAYRQELSKIVKDRCHALFDTVSITRELETFLLSAAKEAIGG